MHEVETMAYAGDVPWHGLGKQVSHTMTPQEMLEAAGLDWKVSKRPAYTSQQPYTQNLYDPSEEGFMHVPDQYFVCRDSDNSVLSHCGSSYVPFQNDEVMRFFKKFTDAGKMQMETAGSLKMGRNIWGLAKITGDFTLAGGDEISGYMLLNNSHQVGKAMTIMLTPIRVVCNNTLTLALQQEGTRFRVPHLQMFDEQIAKAAEQALGISDIAMQDFKQKADFLSSVKAPTKNVEHYVADLFQPALIPERTKAGQNLPDLRDELKGTALKVLDAIETSPGSDMKSAKGTWWGVFNGVTYVMDHQRRSQEEGNALHSAWFGSAANVKRKALDTALEFAKAA